MANNTHRPPRISDEARRYIEQYPLVRQAYSRSALVAHTLDRIWRPDPDTPYGGEPRTDEELREARELIHVRAYLKDLHGRLQARARRRAEKAYVKFVNSQSDEADRRAA